MDLKRVKANLNSILVRCEEGDPHVNWLPTISRLANEALIACEDEPPTVADQWIVVDKWWTDVPERRYYIVLKADGEKCTVKYEQKTKTFSIEKEV